MVSNLKAVLAVLGLVVFGAACSQNTDSSRQGIDPRPEVAAPARIEQSFAIQTSASPQALNVDKARLSLRKDALEKEFLLQTQLIQLPYAPQFQGLKSRIVAFRLRGDTVYLLEATKGHTVTNDLPQTL
ncbi:MAG TPA: hypothetical protein VFV50_08305, partial [Bdellovibrionales bacterium]|nr:hypothetical protein [Bdellovibrionales bacterium]